MRLRARGRCVIKQRDNFMFRVGRGVPQPYPVAIRVLKLYEVEAVTAAWGSNENLACPRIY